MRLCFRFGALLLSMACAAWSQTTASTLAAMVKDSSGAVIPGAKVQVINEASGVTLGAVSNSAGLYRVIGLSPVSYRVEVEAQGFQKVAHPGVPSRSARSSSSTSHCKSATYRKP
jgi:hypothetical protein